MLIGEKIYLRPLGLKDSEYTLMLRQDIEGISELMGYIYPVNLENEIEWIKEIHGKGFRDKIYFAIIEKNSDKFVGYISVQNIHYLDRTADFGIIISKDYRGKGYGKEAIEKFFNYLKNVIGIRKVNLRVLKENKTAIELYKKVGFYLEGELKAQVYQNTQFKDVLIMSKFL